MLVEMGPGVSVGVKGVPVVVGVAVKEPSMVTFPFVMDPHLQ
jgi:hypothetical protein